MDKDWYGFDKDRMTRYRAKILYEAYRIYGFKCQRCEFDNPIILEFHHINGIENSSDCSTQDVLLRIIKENKIIDDVELLCPNHHKLSHISKNHFKKRVFEYKE